MRGAKLLLPRTDLGQVVAPPGSETFHLWEGEGHPHGRINIRLPDGGSQQHLGVGDVVVPGAHKVEFSGQ